MSTRSAIGIKEADIIRSIYCHWDGYPENNGKILYKYYNSKEKVEELLKLGDLSSLHENINPPEGVKHDFNEPAENTCVFYHRDRGEEFQGEIITHDRESMRKAFGWCEYGYVYDTEKNEWYYYDLHESGRKDLIKLKDKLKGLGVI